jgi:hypothetical protein
LDFIARFTAHIPDKGQVMIRYYGLYSNAHRGKERKRGLAASGREIEIPMITPSSSPATLSNPGRQGCFRRPLKKRFPSN